MKTETICDPGGKRTNKNRAFMSVTNLLLMLGGGMDRFALVVVIFFSLGISSIKNAKMLSMVIVSLEVS